MGNNSTPDGVYYIHAGYVKIYSISDAGDERLHIIYGSGEIFPLIWAYLKSAREPLFYQAVSTCVLWRISRSHFLDQVRQNHKLASAMSLQLARQFLFYVDRVDNLEYKDINERVVYRLLFLANRFGYKEGTTTIIDAPLTHDLFATSVNMTRESVSRVLEKLDKQELIKKTDGHIHIIDMPALSKKLSKPANFDNWYLK